MGGSGIQVQLKFMAKPGQQVIVRRTIYVRVKKAFEAAGIGFAVTGAAMPVADPIKLAAVETNKAPVGWLP